MKAKTVGAGWALAAAVGVGLAGSWARATSVIYWDGADGLWTLNTNWSTASVAALPNPTNSPGAADDVVFNISTLNIARTIKLNGSQSAQSLRFCQTNNTTITNNAIGDTLSLGGNITADSGSGSGSVTLSMSNLVLTADSVWTNNKTADLMVSSTTNIVGNATTGTTRQLTLSNTKTGATTISGVLGNGGAGGNLAVTINSTSTGAVKFVGANTYTGGTTLSTGWVQVGVDGVGSVGSITSGAFGTGGLLLNGGTLTSNGYAERTFLNAVTIGGDVILGATSQQTGPLTFSASADLGSVMRTLTVNSNVQFDGVVSNTGGGLTKAGTGMLSLGRANTYSGTTNITGGTLKYSTNDAIAGGDVTVNAATLDLGDSHTDTVGTVTLDGGGKVIGATSALASTGTFEMKNGSVAVSLAGSGIALNKTTPGTVTLSGANTYSGVTTLSEGRINLGVAEIADTSGPLGRSAVANPGSIVLAGGYLQYSSVNQNDYSGRFSTAAGQQYNVDTNGQPVTWATPLTSPGGSLTKSGGTGALILTGANTFSGVTTVSAGTLQLGDGTVGHDGSVAGDIANNAALSYNLFGMHTYAGMISGSGIVTKLGNGTLRLSGSNTYAGTTRIDGGTLQFGTRSSLYNGITGSWTKANLTVASGATAAFNVGGTSEFTTSNVTMLLTNLGGLGGAISNNGLKAGSSIGFDTTNAVGSFEVANKIANSTSTGGGAIGVTKLGANTLVLSNANTYTGATKVNAGTLLVNGSLAAASAVTVASGATLGGTNGAVLGSITVAGTIAPGSGTTTGKLTTGAEIWTGTGAYAVDITNATGTAGSVSGWDSLVMDSVSQSDGFKVKVLSSAVPANFNATSIYEWVIAEVKAGSFDTRLLRVDTTGFTGGASGLFSLDTTTRSGGGENLVLRYTYSAVPEATTVLLAMVGLAPVLLQRRRGL